ELGWFDGHLRARGLPSDAPRQPPCKAYCDFLLALNHVPYPVAMTAAWAIERAYFDAWSGALPAAPAFGEFVEHWTTPEFGAYVADLASAADRALGTATPAELHAAEDAFIWAARYEHAFWQMAMS